MRQARGFSFLLPDPVVQPVNNAHLLPLSSHNGVSLHFHLVRIWNTSLPVRQQQPSVQRLTNYA